MDEVLKPNPDYLTSPKNIIAPACSFPQDLNGVGFEIRKEAKPFWVGGEGENNLMRCLRGGLCSQFPAFWGIKRAKALLP